MAATAYATFTEDEISIVDRNEQRFNARRAGILALADEHTGHTVRGATDDGLRRLARTYRRQVEDLDAGDLDGGAGRRRMLVAKLADIETEQAVRAALAGSWLAAETGTHCYTAFHGRGGLRAVLEQGATPPSYDLAALLDWENWKRGRLHVLDWGTEA